MALNGAFPETIASIRNQFAGLLPHERIHVFDVLDPVPDELDHPARIASEMCREAFLARLNPDVVHVSSLIEGLRGNAVASIGRLGLDLPTAVTFYDAIPLVFRSHYLADAEAATWYEHRVEQVRRADLLLAISRSSAAEASEYLGIEAERIVNIGAAADPIFRPGALDDKTRSGLLSRFGIRRPFAMYTGGLDFRKNIEALLAGYAALPRAIQAKHQLVIACECGREEKAHLLELAQLMGLRGDAVVMTGAVGNSELAALYSLAKVFVFPSLHEGFGLPVLEAMQCGAPVIGSNRSSIPEVIGLEEALFDPGKPGAIRDAIHRALTDEAQLDRLKRHSVRQAKKFSWAAVGRHAIAAFEQLDRRRRSQPAPSTSSRTKRRLAYVSPIPPARSGIATYSRELLPCLRNFYDIDVVVDAEQQDSELAGAFQVIAAADFLAQADRYDRVLYHVGNSEFHDYMLPLLEAVPGVVVLHDFYLGGLVRHQALREGGEAQWLRAVHQNHGASAVLECMANVPHEAAVTYPCCNTVIAHSLGLIVHSAYARSLAHDWLTDEWTRRVLQVPLLCPTSGTIDREGARQRLDLPPDARIICSFGLMGPTKRNLDLLSAWMNSSAFQDARCLLIFAGAPAGGDYGAAVEQEISKHGLGSRVRITGWIEDRRYIDYLAACDLAVQLRGESRGETSLALLDCLSHGIPTIANANGSIAEVPGSVLSLLPDQFEQAELREAIDALYMDGAAARTIGAAARRYIETEHAPAEVAKLYHEQIERFYDRSANLVGALAPLSADLPVDEVGRLSEIAAEATYLPPCRTLHLDVSELADPVTPDARRRILSDAVRRLAGIIPRQVRLELIRHADDLGAYVKAHRSLAALFGLTGPLFPDEPAEFASEDILFCLDSRQEAVALRSGTLEDLRCSGLQTFFLIDDLRDAGLRQLPVQSISGIFADWLWTVGRSCGAVCSSLSVADELRACVQETGVEQAHFRVSFVHGGLAGHGGHEDLAEAIHELIGQPVSSSRSGDDAQEGRPANFFV